MNKKYAKDCQCVVCGKQAVAFWPVYEPDIPSYPYCRECLDKEKMELLIKLFGKEEGEMLMEMDKKNRRDTP